VDLGNDSIQCDKRLCFVMDPPRDGGEPKNKKRKVAKKDKKAGQNQKTPIGFQQFSPSSSHLVLMLSLLPYFLD